MAGFDEGRKLFFSSPLSTIPYPPSPQSTMSKPIDYSKFDHIDSDDDSDQSATPLNTSPPNAPAVGKTTKHPSIPNRYIFNFGQQKIYEWEQTLEEVTICIDAPPLPSVHPASYIIVNIAANKLQVGLKGHDRYFIDENTFDKVKVEESSWYLDDGVITIILCKAFRGQTWEGVLNGHARLKSQNTNTNTSGAAIQERVDPFVKQEMQKSMMLERFQEENPGFDFRDASFNGEVPDPRTFMGGVGYNH